MAPFAAAFCETVCCIFLLATVVSMTRKSAMYVIAMSWRLMPVMRERLRPVKRVSCQGSRSGRHNVIEQKSEENPYGTLPGILSDF